jgi:dihydrolipoamide dehydrogenase
VPWLDAREIELVRGQGRLERERRVRVGDEVLLAREAVIVAVGSGALIPPIPGLAEVGAWSNRAATTSRSVPRRLIVLGGGAVGVEMAQAWASLGSQVTVIEALQRLLPREEPFVGEELREALEQLGVQVHTGVRANAVSRDGEQIRVRLESGSEVLGDRLLVAIGRKPLTHDLGLESVGLESVGYVEVDDHMQVIGAPGLYAVGDVNGRSLLTHSGKYQARIAADHILGEDAVASSDGPIAPRVVCSPTLRSPRWGSRLPPLCMPGSPPSRSTCPPVGAPARASTAGRAGHDTVRGRC